MKEKVKQLLKKVWERSEGSERNEIHLPNLAKEEGLTFNDAEDTYDYLEGEGWAEKRSMAPSVILTHQGIVNIPKILGLD